MVKFKPSISPRQFAGATLFWVLAGTNNTFAQTERPLWPDVAALLTSRCTICHSGPDAPLGLTLTSHSDALAGSWNGAVILPGNVLDSPLMHRVLGKAQPRMPLDGPPFLTTEQIALLADWIAAGAPLDQEAASRPQVRADGDRNVNFADISPILKQRCIICHSDNGRLSAPPEGLRLTDYASLLAGAERVAVIPGNPQASELYRRIIGLASPRMPHDGPPWLSDDQIELIRTWIAEGAVDENGVPAPMPVGRKVRLRGKVTGPNQIDGANFVVTSATRVEDSLRIGNQAEVRATITADGTLVATRLRAR